GEMIPPCGEPEVVLYYHPLSMKSAFSHPWMVLSTFSLRMYLWLPVCPAVPEAVAAHDPDAFYVFPRTVLLGEGGP
ncbi:MAG: hypothetical protein Q8765_02600, partial [Sweet potato little leaf phytoplasma]|nr:hypothetical protein [Sweet potato little leaf phytoplasma]